jgi:hypothetical protein
MPNFLIIGAAKAGTSALYYYLKQHPQIYMSPVKEPQFFAYEDQKLDFHGPGIATIQNSITNIEAYCALFQEVSNETAIGEASTIYLYNPKAPERIRHYIPDVKMIAILRNPVDRAYSGYLMHVRDGREILDFPQALQAEETRIRNNWSFGRYTSWGFYYTQLRRYFDMFERDQIRVYLYEDMTGNAASLLRDIFQFLSVEETFDPDLSVRYNVSGMPKNKAFHALVKRPNPIKPVLKQLLPAWLTTSLKDRYLQYSNVKPQLEPEVRQQLLKVYRDEILKLQDLIQRDLSKWLE